MSDLSRIWQIYDAHRTALLNRKYYGHRLENYRYYERIFQIAAAIVTPGAAIGALAVWQTSVGSFLWFVVATVAGLLAFLRPFLGLSSNVERFSKLYTGHANLYHDLKYLVDEISFTKELTPEIVALFQHAQRRERELGPEDDPKPIAKLIEKYEKEVNKEVPVGNFWLPK